jgi:hypothetical protein
MDQSQMIESLVSDYKQVDRDIDALTYVVLTLLVLIIGRAALLIYESQFSALWQLLTYVVPLVSVLVVVRVANRLLLNGNIIREEDRRQEIVRTTHNLIAIANDLKARVGFVKTILAEGRIPLIALVQVAKTIEERYETLLHRDAYKYLPGACVDIITRMSGDIFGIGVLAEGLRLTTTEKPESALTPITANEDGSLPPRLDELMSEIQQLIDLLFEVRGSIEAKKALR